MIKNSLVIIDYGMGNTRSILNMIRKAGGDAIISNDIKILMDAKALILPGVGSFDNAIIKLKSLGIWEVLNRKVIDQNIPFLGICIGMQLLFESSDEGKLNGLGWLSGCVKRFGSSQKISSKKIKVPHMGWNIIKPVNFDSLYSGLDKEARFYFVHTYYADCSDSNDILAKANYGNEFVCSVNKDKIWGVQFHPEKSHRFGMIFFENFLRVIKC